MPPRSPEIIDSTHQYLNEIGQHDLLTAEQEVELAKQIELGKAAEVALSSLNGEIDDDGWQRLAELAQLGLEAREKFINSNLRLVVSIAKKYQSKARSNDLLDLINEGNTGLIKAVNKFDYRKGFKFSTYASWWIRQAVTRSMANTDYAIRVPAHEYEKLGLVGTAIHKLSQTSRSNPTTEEIAEVSGLSPEKVENLRVIYEMQTNLISLDMSLGEHSKGAEMSDFVADDNQDVESEVLTRVESEELFSLITELLSERDAEIILKRFGFLGKVATLDKLGKEYGLTRERIRQLEVAALAKIKKALEVTDDFKKAG